MPSNAARSSGESVIAARLERPLAEVMDLPEEQVLVERARRDDAAGPEPGERLLRLREIADGADVELLLAGRDGPRGKRRACRRRGPRAGPSRAPCLRRGRAGTSTPRDASRSRTSRKGQRAAAPPALAISSGFAPSGTNMPTDRAAGHAPAEVAPRGRAAGHRLPREPARRAGARRKRAERRGRRARRSRAGGRGRDRSGRSVSKRTWRWGSRRPGPRGTTASRWPPSSDPWSRAPPRPWARRLDEPTRGAVVLWLERLEEWNARIDLTAARSREELVDLDAGRRARPRAADAAGARVVDVGTGAGAPGLALALLRERPAGDARRAAGEADELSPHRPRRGRPRRRGPRAQRGARRSRAGGRGTWPSRARRSRRPRGSTWARRWRRRAARYGSCWRRTALRRTRAPRSRTTAATPGRSRAPSAAPSRTACFPELSRSRETPRFSWPAGGRRETARRMTGTRESELAALRKLAEDLAKGRGERVTTGHLLAAIASNAGGAAELLKSDGSTPRSCSRRRAS